MLNQPCPISHNWPQEDFCIEIYSGISIIKRLKPAKGGNGGGKRTSVVNFSRASRKRLLQKMAACRNMDAGYFATFTYPGSFEYTWQECKAHMAALRKRILRRFPQARGIWRMEIKPRLSGVSQGIPVPHYHILLFGIPYGREVALQAVLSQMWDEIANYHDRDVPFLRSEVTQIRSRSHAVYYASKYAAKLDDGLDEGFGRHWGFFGEWDESMSARHILTGAEMIQLKRLIRGWNKGAAKTRAAKLMAMDMPERAADVLAKARRRNRMFAAIRQDFGMAIFGLGDKDDMTGATTTVIDLIINAQRQPQH